MLFLLGLSSLAFLVLFLSFLAFFVLFHFLFFLSFPLPSFLFFVFFSDGLTLVVRMRSDIYYVKYLRGSLPWVAIGIVCFSRRE